MPEKDPLVQTLEEWMEVFMHRSMRNFILYAKESGLSMSQIGALFRIMHKGSSGVTDLGEELGVTSAAASQMLERLVQQGLVLRSEDPNDRRVKQIVLTDKGRSIIQESIHSRQAWLRDLAETMNEPEKAQAAAALSLLIAKANQLDELKKFEETENIGRR